MTALSKTRSNRLLALLCATALSPVGLLPGAALAQNVPAQAPPAQSPGVAAPQGAVVLPGIDVSGRAESALDPVRGFVANQEITGTKTDTPLIENPQSISVVPRDQIDARQAQTLGEALRYTAGVRGENYGTDSRTDWFQLRGFNAQDNGIFLNGLRYNTGYAGSTFETYGLERYEILRGPTSVLYGQIAPGGLVNMVQRRPTDTAQGEVRLTAGSFGRLQGQGTSSGPLTADGKWSYSITGLLRDSDTPVDSTQDDRIFLAPSLTFKPDDNTSMTVQGYYQRDRTNGNQFLPYSATVDRGEFGRISRKRFTGEQDYDKFNREQLGIGYELSHRFDNVWSVQQNVRYAQTEINWNQVYGNGLQADNRSLNRIAYRANIDVATIQVDNQVKAQFNTGPVTHTVLGGFDYSQVNYRNAQYFAFASPLDVYRPAYGSPVPALTTPYDNVRQVNSQYGLYAQDQIRFDRFVFTAGIRQDWALSDIDDRDARSTRYQNDKAFTWRAGMLYLADNGLAPYASYARSFQPQIGTDRQGRGWDPLEGEQYEVGLKFQPAGVNSLVQLAAFQLTQQNTLTPDVTSPFDSVSVGEIRVRGIELEGVADLGSGLSLVGSVTYLDPEITKSNAAGEKGERPAGVAKMNAGLYADYTFVDARGPLSGLSLGFGARYLGNTVASVKTGPGTGSVVDATTLFDASIRYDLAKFSESMKGFKLAVTGSNLFDTRYVGRCSGEGGCFYGNRLNVLGSIAYTW